MSEHGNEEPAAPALPARTNVLSQTHARQQAAPTQHATSQQIPAPYQPYTYAQPQYVAQSRVVPYDKTWHWIKIALTVTSIIFCLILLGLSVAASMGPGWDSWNITIYWFGPLAGIAGLWDVAELITLFGCGKRNGAEHRRGIHPGAHVGMDLCIWLTGLMCILLSVMSYFSATDQIRYCQEYLASSDTSSSSYRYYYCDEDEYAIISQGFIIPALRALLAFAALLTFVHFLIFVRACVETNQRNRTRQTYIMVPPQQMYYGPPAGMAPYSHPSIPPQAHMADGAQGSPMNEKFTGAAQHPEGHNPSLTGFYAPSGASATQAFQPHVAPPEGVTAGNGV